MNTEDADQTEWTTIVKAVTAAAYRLMGARVIDISDVDDIVQDVCVDAFVRRWPMGVQTTLEKIKVLVKRVTYKIADRHRREKRRARCREEQFGSRTPVEAAAAEKQAVDVSSARQCGDLQETLLAQAAARSDVKFVEFLKLDYSPDGDQRPSIEHLAGILLCSSRKISRYRAQKKKLIVAIRGESRARGGGVVKS